jgi:hypothetical protein
MISFGANTEAIKDMLYKSSSLSSSHVITAEWNYNSYRYPIDYGSYFSSTLVPEYPSTYIKGSNTFDNGSKKIKFEGTNTYDDDIQHKKYVSLKDCFKPIRPDAGILHPVWNMRNDTTILDNLSGIKINNLTNSSTRIYPVSDSSQFKYWSSIRRTYVSDSEVVIGYADDASVIENANPFVVYSGDAFRTNKIVIKTQTQTGYPVRFSVDVLRSGSWVEVYSQLDSDSTDMLSGNLSIYASYSEDEEKYLWDTYPNVDNVANIPYATGLLKADRNGIDISGIRLNVTKISKSGGSVDLIEISPRFIADISEYTQAFSVNSNIGDVVLGLPTGSIVTSTGSLTIFGELKEFDQASATSVVSDMMKPNVKFNFFYKLDYSPNPLTTVTYHIPIRSMYCDTWDSKEDYSANISLQDYTKFFKETQCQDILLGSTTGIKTSAALRILLDSIGFTKLSFDKTEIPSGSTLPNNYYSFEDTTLPFFYARREQTIMEVLESLATSIQASMFIDSSNNLRVLTKERVSMKNGDNDHWIIGDNNADPITDSEYAELENNTFLPNIESFSESTILPITDGSVSYQNLGIPKASTFILQYSNGNYEDLVPQNNDKKNTNYPASILDRQFEYKRSILWEPSDTENTLGAGILIENVSAERPSVLFKNSYPTESDRVILANSTEEAQEKVYSRIKSLNKKSSMVLRLENNDISAGFRNKFSGYVTVDSELIKYNGILFQVALADNFDKPPAPELFKEVIVYSSEQYQSILAELPSGSWFEPKSLMVEIDLDFIGTFGDQMMYRVLSDGRGQENTAVSEHIASQLSEWGSKFMVEIGGNVSSGIEQVLQVRKYSYNIPNSTIPLEQNSQMAGYIKIYNSSKVSDSVNASGQPINDFSPENSTEYQRSLSTELNMDTKSKTLMAGYKKNFGFTPQRVGATFRIFQSRRESSLKDSIGGIGFYLSEDQYGTTGYFLDLSTIGSSDGSTSLVTLYKVYREGGINKVTTFKKIIPANPPEPQKIQLNVVKFSSIASEMPLVAENPLSKDSNGVVSVADVGVNIRNTGTSLEFEVYFEGSKILGYDDLKDPSPLPATGNVGLFVRGDTEGIFESVYAAASPISEETNFTTQNYSMSERLKLEKISRGFVPEVVRGSSNETSTRIEFEDFAKVVREVKRFDVRFNKPAFVSRLIEFSKVNPYYSIKSYKYGPFGAKFWAYNTAPSSIVISEEFGTPIKVSGVGLETTGSGSISIEDVFKEVDEELSIGNEFYKNRELYGKQTFTLNGEFITKYSMAKNIIKWIMFHASKEKKEIQIRSFVNPMIELGDKARIFYKEKGYSEDIAGENKMFIIGAIDYTVDSSGPQMSLILREML